MQEQLAIKAASAYNCTLKPASASAWPLLFLLPAFYRAFYTLLQHELEATAHAQNFLFFSQQIQPTERHKSSFFVLPHRTGSFFDRTLCVPSLFGLSHYLSFYSAQVYFCFSPFSSSSIWVVDSFTRPSLLYSCWCRTALCQHKCAVSSFVIGLSQHK